MSPDATGTDDAVIDTAARQLLRGGLVAFPTETVYGLGADAENPDAIAKIYAAKQRPINHPLIVHIAAQAPLDYWAPTLSEAGERLVQAFWPGPLTLIVSRAEHIPAAVSGGQATLGLRCPSHPVAQALLSRFACLKPGGRGGVAAPSANKFGQLSPTQAQHVREAFAEFSPSELIVLDGGPSEVGIESTIIDVSDPNTRPSILRPGHISAADIAEVLGEVPGLPHGHSPKVSGSLISHYAPRTPLHLFSSVSWREALATARTKYPKLDGPIAVLMFDPPEQASEGIHFIACAKHPREYAHTLYAMLHTLDKQHYALLLVQQPPTTIEWQGVNDRLMRAAATFF